MPPRYFQTTAYFGVRSRLRAYLDTAPGKHAFFSLSSTVLVEERAGERRFLWSGLKGKNLSAVALANGENPLSPLVPHGARETEASRVCLTRGSVKMRPPPGRARWPEKLLAHFTARRIRMRGEKENLFFVDRRKLLQKYRDQAAA